MAARQHEADGRWAPVPRRRVGQRPHAARHGLAPPPRRIGPSPWALPAPAAADPDGVVGIGADLAPATLVDAYRRGIFPWPHPGVPLPWFSPDPRGVLPLDGLRVSRSLARTLRRSGWTSTLDADIEAVIAGCATGRGDEGTWITPQMSRAYLRLHDLGWAHSLEIWDDQRLVGGIYGVQIGGIFTGESMFHREADASKVALLDLVSRFRAAGGQLLDVQLLTPHLARLGAVEIPRSRFVALLEAHGDDDVRLLLDRAAVARLAPTRDHPEG